MDINRGTDNSLINKELSTVNDGDVSLKEINREINDLKKSTSDLEIFNANLERKINDAKIESAKLMTEVKLYDKLIDVKKEQINNVLINVDVEKEKLNDIQNKVWNNLEYFSDNTIDMLNDEKFDEISNKCDEDLRTMEEDIIKLAAEVEAMSAIAEAQEKKIEEIKKITESQLDDLDGN